VLAEKKLNWQETWLNLRKGEQFEPEYLKLNPKAVVPTLVHDGKVLRESTVIVEYLDDVFPEPSLRPADLYDRSRMRLIMKAFDEDAHSAIGILTYAVVLRHQMNELKTPEELETHFQKIADPGRRERQRSTHKQGLKSPPAKVAIGMLRKVITLLDESLNNGRWIAGPTFSLADASAIPYMVRAQALNLDGLWQDKPAVSTWLVKTVDRCNRYTLDKPWGSVSFNKIVQKYVDEEAGVIENLIHESDSVVR